MNDKIVNALHWRFFCIAMRSEEAASGMFCR